MSLRSSLLWAWVLAGAAWAGSVEAQARSPDDELRLATVEVGGWAETIASLETDLHAEGRLIHVVVFDHSARLAACGRYGLALDPAGARAFAIGACDPATNATELRLVSRTELFAHDGPVPRPLAIALSATEVRVGADMGGAALTGGAALDCSIRVRPFLDDLEHGTVVYLQPDRYDVRPTETTVLVSVEPDGWSLHARASAALIISYEVVERASGAVVLRDRATLGCSDASRVASAVPEEPVSSRAARVLVLESTHLPRISEVLAAIDVHEPVGDEAVALRLLRERAAAIGADAVVGVQFNHGHGSGPIHLSGLAVRFIELPR
jgi:hypothetical protein